MWTKCVHSWSLDELEVTEGREVQTKVLEGVGGLVDKENVYEERIQKETTVDRFPQSRLPSRISNPCTLTYASA
jgi:hypothetical protein